MIRAKRGLKIQSWKLKINSIVFLSILIIIFFAVHNFYGHIYWAIFGTVIWLVACFTLPPDDYLQLCFLLAPSISWLKFVGNPSAVYGYTFLVFAIKYLLLGRKKIVDYFPYILHAISVMITVIIYNDLSLLASLIRFLLYMLTVTQIIVNKDEEYKIKSVSFFVLGEAINVIVGIVYSLQKGNLLSGFFSGVRDDRNYYAAIISISIIVSIYLILKYRKNYMYSFLLIFFFGGFLTQSRTFILSLVFSLLLIVLMFFKDKMGTKVLFFFFTFSCVAFVIYPYISPLIDSILFRFQEKNVFSGNGRLLAWDFYIRLALSTPVRFLFGSGNSTNYLANSYNIIEHNTFIQAFFSIGVVGTITMVCCYGKLFSKIVSSNGKIEKLSYLPLITGMFVFFTINVLYSDILNTVIIICFIIMDIGKSTVGVEKGFIDYGIKI